MVADIAIETDYEFTAWRFGGDSDASAAYASTLFAAISSIYSRDTHVGLQISYLRIWDTSADPWNGDDTIDQLLQFQDYWNANMGSVQRHAAHYLSGRGLGAASHTAVLCAHPAGITAFPRTSTALFPFRSKTTTAATGT